MKKGISLPALTCLLAVLLSAGCGKQAEPAEPIVLPAVNEIDSIIITTLDGSEVSYSDQEWIGSFLTVLAQAEATTKESIQDIPINVEAYGKVDISNSGGITTLFYYADGEKYCIEQPYQGIYETNVDIDALVKGGRITF